MKELTLNQIKGLKEYKLAETRINESHKQIDLILAEMEELLKAKLEASHNVQVAAENIKQIIRNKKLEVTL